MSVLTEKEDLKAVIEFLKARSEINEKCLFLLGASQGGFVSLLTAAELKEEIRALVLYFPALCIPDDWRKEYPEFNFEAGYMQITPFYISTSHLELGIYFLTPEGRSTANGSNTIIIYIPEKTNFTLTYNSNVSSRDGAATLSILKLQR